MSSGQSKANVLILGMGAYAFGKERRAVSCVRNMRGIQPFFLVSKWEDGSVSRLLRQNHLDFAYAPLGYLGRARPSWTLVTLLHMPYLQWQVLRTYRKRRCQALLILDLRTLVNTFFSVLALRCLRRQRVTLYLGDIPENNRFFRMLARWVDRLHFPVIAISEAVRQGLADVGISGHKIQVIYNGVDIQRFETAAPYDLRGAHGWSGDCILCGYAGQFAANKGIWDFVRAAELVLEQSPNCRFVLFGRADQRNGLYRKIQEYLRSRHLCDRIAFTGWIEEMEKAYAALDVAVFPSRHEEPLGNVNVEATAAGVPIVATRVGGIPEVVVDGQTGFLVEKSNPAQLADRILRLAGSEALRERTSRAARSRARKMFDIEKNALLVERIALHA